MTPEQFERCAKWLVGHFDRLGFSKGSGQALSVQYVGGEVLTVPQAHLQEIVVRAREIFSEVFDHVRDGVQSNLIGSPARISHLVSLFGDRVGTSVDHFGEQRTLAGSAQKYRTIAISSIDRVRRRSVNVPGIFVVDKQGLSRTFDEYMIARTKGYGLTLRAVFNGGRGVNEADPLEIANEYVRVFDDWAMTGRYGVEPFRHLLVQRLGELGARLGHENMQGCPFQSNCADASLNLDPNGDLYICLDTSDSSQMQLGNALTDEFDDRLFEMIRDRSNHLDSTCVSCDYVASCAGGCMSEAYHLTGSPFGKTGLCVVWKRVFERIDALVSLHGLAAVAKWAEGLK